MTPDRTFTLYIGDSMIPVPVLVAPDMTPTQVARATARTVNAQGNLPVTATASGRTVSLSAKDRSSGCVSGWVSFS